MDRVSWSVVQIELVADSLSLSLGWLVGWLVAYIGDRLVSAMVDQNLDALSMAFF